MKSTLWLSHSFILEKITLKSKVAMNGFFTSLNLNFSPMRYIFPQFFRFGITLSVIGYLKVILNRKNRGNMYLKGQKLRFSEVKSPLIVTFEFRVIFSKMKLWGNHSVDFNEIWNVHKNINDLKDVQDYFHISSSIIVYY